MPGSPAELLFSLDDEILSLDQEPYSPELFEPLDDMNVIFRVRRMNRDLDITLTPDLSHNYYELPEVSVLENAGDDEVRRLAAWIGAGNPQA